MSARPHRGRMLLASGCAAAAMLFGAPAAFADHGPPSSALKFTPCGQTPAAATTVCATADLPMDYGRPHGQQVHIAVAKVPATGQRIGSLFFNFGGPGGTAVDYLQSRGASTLWKNLNEHFDIIGFDPRGVGQSTPTIDCKTNQEKEGVYAQPFFTPLDLSANALLGRSVAYVHDCVSRNGEILSHVSTANVARDMDAIRDLLGERKLNYLGFSYGTFLGATYASLFPNNYRAMVLDGPIDATSYINKPWQDLQEQTQGFERALDRFFGACAGNQPACSNFGGSDPEDAYDALVEAANAHPIPAPNSSDPRPVDGDDINFAAAGELYAKELWPELGEALAEAQAGDASLFRDLTDGSYGRNDDGSYSNALDLYFTIGATEQQYPRDANFYFERGDEAWGLFYHEYWNNGYTELPYGLWPARDRDAYDGPFRVRSSSPTPLVVATTYDPATPYHGALRLVRDLGNARLITMRGDGHTAYGGESACIDSAVESYLNTLALPAAGTQCRQDTGFQAPQQVKSLVARTDKRDFVMRVPSF